MTYRSRLFNPVLLGHVLLILHDNPTLLYILLAVVLLISFLCLLVSYPHFITSSSSSISNFVLKSYHVYSVANDNRGSSVGIRELAADYKTEGSQFEFR
jgi:hypothetical protein